MERGDKVFLQVFNAIIYIIIIIIILRGLIEITRRMDKRTFPGGPHNTLILIDYAHHVVVTVWNEQVFIFLNK